MVIQLGYHRLSTIQSDSEPERQSKILLFWMTYWLDTSFSFSLGHAPVIRDYDITVPRLSHGSIIPSSFVDGFNYSTMISSLQCQIVAKLYSPRSLESSVQERSMQASRLVEELQEVWDARGEVSICGIVYFKCNMTYISRRHPAQMTKNMLVSPSSSKNRTPLCTTARCMSSPLTAWRTNFADLTSALVQHATISTATGESPALEPARQALRLNIDVWKTYKYLPDFIWSGHCHW